MAIGGKAQQRNVAHMDSVEISLVTCSPHEEVYSLYGHSALRYHDLQTGQDLAFNWGVFNFKAPHFVFRFVFGLTDYELGVFPFGAFCEYYRQWGSEVTEQVLNLTVEEKLKVAMALAENLLPENRVYRYNFLYDNCSTRPRNIIEQNIDGRVAYAERPDYMPSFRQMIHAKSAHRPWATMGNDLLLGMKADLKATQREQEFLPENLMYDFAHANIEHNGKSRPLVKSERIVIAAGVQKVKKEFPLTPLECSLLLALVSLLVVFWEYRKGRCLVWFDALLMSLLGLVGCIILVMFFSQHPTTSTNLQLLLFNPLHLFFIRSVLRRDRQTRYWTLLLIQVCLFLVCSLVQDYAYGVNVLALSLLLRHWIHRRNES